MQAYKQNALSGILKKIWKIAMLDIFMTQSFLKIVVATETRTYETSALIS